MTSLLLLVPTIEGREESLERTMRSYRATAGHDFREAIVTGYPSIGAAWASELPMITTDLAHLGTDDVTAECDWSTEIVEEWETHRGLAVPLVTRMPGRTLESHGQHGAMFVHRTQVYWCGVPVVPKCCYQAIADALDIAGRPHYFSDNVVSDVLRMHGHQQIALPRYRLGHWWEAGGATGDRWNADEAGYRYWRSTFPGLPAFDAPEIQWAEWRVTTNHPAHT